MTIDSAISMAGLTKHYPGVQALTDLSLEVPAGSIYGFLGPNGAGKSTTIKVLAGLTRPTRGSASVAGIPVVAGPGYRREVGYLAQEPQFYDWMTGRETLRFVASLYPAADRAGDDGITAVLKRVGLADAADRRTATYSGGMRQRLGIAQALIGSPAVLLLDEPVSALDPIGRREVLDLMRELRGEVTVFYSTHILDDVERVSDHVAILDGGRLVRSAPTAELLVELRPGPAARRHRRRRRRDRRRHRLDPRRHLGRTRRAQRRPSQLSRPRRAGRRPPRVQAAITRFAADHGQIVTENHLVRLGLEDVFLRLVNTKEHAA